MKSLLRRSRWPGTLRQALSRVPTNRRLRRGQLRVLRVRGQLGLEERSVSGGC